MFRKNKQGIAGFLNRWKHLLQYRSDNSVWNDWAEYVRHDYQKLVALVKDKEVRLSLRARALALLLSPTEIQLPIKWNGSYHELDNIDDVAFSGSPAEIQAMAIDLVCSSAEEALSMQKRDNEKASEILFRTNSIAIQLLPLLPVESTEARSVFGIIFLNDPSPFCGIDDASGYNPFRRLINTENMPEVWITEADNTMRQIIQEEAEGKRKPRKEWEDAYICYNNHISLDLYSEKWQGDSLFANRLEFLLGLGKPLEFSMLSHFHKIASFLSDKGYDKLLESYLREVIRAFRAGGIHSGFQDLIPFLDIGTLKNDQTISATISQIKSTMKIQAEKNEKHSKEEKDKQARLYRRMS